MKDKINNTKRKKTTHISKMFLLRWIFDLFRWILLKSNFATQGENIFSKGIVNNVIRRGEKVLGYC